MGSLIAYNTSLVLLTFCMLSMQNVNLLESKQQDNLHAMALYQGHIFIKL
jgi:hypothetical protein